MNAAIKDLWELCHIRNDGMVETCCAIVRTCGYIRQWSTTDRLYLAGVSLGDVNENSRRCGRGFPMGPRTCWLKIRCQLERVRKKRTRHSPTTEKAKHVSVYFNQQRQRSGHTVVISTRNENLSFDASSLESYIEKTVYTPRWGSR
jgi:hypothetical protein